MFVDKISSAAHQVDVSHQTAKGGKQKKINADGQKLHLKQSFVACMWP